MRRGRFLFTRPAALTSGVMAVFLGTFILAADDLQLFPLFVVVAYSSLLLSVGACIRISRDILAPLIVFLFFMFARYCAPAVFAYVTPFSKIEFLTLVGITKNDFEYGHVLALMGMISLAFGWFALHTTPRAPAASPRAEPPWRLGVAAVLGVAIGLTAMLLFIARNTSLIDALTEGTFRSVTVREGTGVYFFLALSLISGTTAACALLLRRGLSVPIALIPPIAGAALFFVLGGRARSATPFLCGLVLVWYERRARRRGQGRWRIAIAASLAAVLSVGALWMLYASDLYRGGKGLSAFTEASSPGNFVGYLRTSAIIDVGQTHALALAADAPGALDGRTFAGALLWPLGEFFPVPARSTGIFLIDETVKFPYRFGVQPSLAGDAYVNFGVLGLVGVPLVFGVLAREIYERFMAGKIHVVVYAVVFVYLLRVYTESIEKWPELMVVTLFTVALIYSLPIVYLIFGATPRALRGTRRTTAER